MCSHDKDMCSHDKDILQLDGLESELLKNGEISIRYDAYSCDSSFNIKVYMNFCPYCGKSIEAILKEIKEKNDRYIEEYVKRQERLKKEAEKLLAERIEANKIRRDNQPKIWADELEKGNFNVYIYDKKEYKAVSKKHLKIILEESGNYNPNISYNKAIVKGSDKVILKADSYELAKSKKVGEVFNCAWCGSTNIKKQYSQAFCDSKCKDNFWNVKRAK